MKKVLSMVLVVILLSSITVVGFAEEKSNVIRISTPELLVCNKSTSSLPSQAYLFYVTVCDWAQYAKAEITVSFNHEVLSCLWKEYPAMGDYVPSVEKERYEDDKRVFSVSYAESPLYQDKKDISFDFMFGARATGAHNLVFEAVAYDKDGNKVEVDLQFDNEIYPEVLSVEEAGVSVLDALPVKQTTICENYGITVQDIQNKIKSDNFRIKDKNGNLLNDDDIVPNGAVIEILYKGLLAYSTKICIAYDVDCDGEVTAADARLALRHSAQLDTLSGVAYFAADVDGVQGITASDARLILRKAAKLDN